MPPLAYFPDGFAWGVATSAFQIEGAQDIDGRGRSIWDTFVDTPGTIRSGHTAHRAGDHYHRYREDVDLMKRLGIDTYRFSISWPRVIPTGSGAVNQAGLDFYDHLVDTLLAAGITPMPTLFHWDLPQSLQDKGGWLDRDTAHAFADYTAVVADRLGDRVRDWITLNEPFEHMALGHALGIHAPGKRLMLDALPVAHHQLLGHGLAVAALRAARADRVLMVNSYTLADPADDSEAAAAATETYRALHHGLFTDPILLGRYPDLSALGLDVAALPVVHDDDLAIISAPIDGLGVNYYSPTRVAAATGPLPFDLVDIPDVLTTDFGWPIVPTGLRDVLLRIGAEYGDALPPLWVTENGCSFGTEPDANGRIADTERISYLDQHIRAVAEAIDAGADVRGYLIWSLLDNFEWAEGYHQRFGLVHVDFATGRRTPKDSFTWFADTIRAVGTPRP